MKSVDYTLYVLTDAKLARGRSHEEVVAAALRGGATLVQYREKNASTRQMIAEATRLRDLCRAYGVPLIVNDRVDIALAVDADGVHVGPDDMPVALARKLMGRDKIVGASAGTIAEARAAIADGADYLGVGAIFATSSKADAGEPIGLDGLQQIVRVSTIPVVGIAGINATNAASVIRAGAVGIAVISAIVSADDIERATRELKTIVEQAKRNFVH
ncbi:MAG: thiamine phosphate synthase [Anaerolineae bacterium]|nr:thiamine phosphate synthase [Anaerolineae bacterium]